MLGNILSTGEQVLILVVLLAVGFLCGKIRIFNDQSISHLSAFALKIVGPCAIVESFCRQFDSAMLRAMGIVALLAFAAHALYAAFAYVCIRGGKEPTRRVLRYGTVFANCGTWACRCSRSCSARTACSTGQRGSACITSWRGPSASCS